MLPEKMFDLRESLLDYLEPGVFETPFEHGVKSTDEDICKLQIGGVQCYATVKVRVGIET